jgi:hypothetical protein
MYDMQESMYLQYKEFCQPLVFFGIYITIPPAGFRAQTAPATRPNLFAGSSDQQFFNFLFRKAFFGIIVVIWCI